VLARNPFQCGSQRRLLRLGQARRRAHFRAREAQALIQHDFEAVDDLGERGDAAMVHQDKKKIAQDLLEL
jgi:hypothetical protein